MSQDNMYDICKYFIAFFVAYIIWKMYVLLFEWAHSSFGESHKLICTIVEYSQMFNASVAPWSIKILASELL